MPCDQIRITTAQAEMQGTDLGILKRALEGLGLHVTMTAGGVFFAGSVKDRGGYVEGNYLAGGKLTVNHKRFINVIKRAYSEQVVKEEAEKLMWTLQETGKNKFVASKPYSDDKVNIEILDDGTIKTTTDKISAANHSSAEQFLLNIDRDLGGTTTVTHKHGAGAAHSHEIGYSH